MKEITIVVNGTEHTTVKGDLTFDEVVKLAYEEPPYGDNTLFSVSYRRGQGKKPEGTLAQGETVKTKEGMIFDVTPTDKS
ncbi:MAG: multiubiquitin domain-containing protein [Phycisphaeraceae bacterium]